MQRVKDYDGHDWLIELTVGKCRVIQAMTGLDLLGIHTSIPTAQQLVEQGPALWDSLWLLVSGQAEERGLDKETWLNGLDATLGGAFAEALEAELCFFSRTRRGDRYGQTVHRLLQLVRSEIALTMDVTLTRQEEEDEAEKRQRITAFIAAQTTGSGSPTSAQASSASIPADTR